MSDTDQCSIDSPPAETSSSVVWAVSLAFWITLLTAAVVYASVALAPRLYAWLQVRHEFLSNAHQLQALESEVDYLERVQHALQTDPEFVRRLAASSISEQTGEAEVIPVSGSLIFGTSDQLEQRMPEIEDPLAADLIQRFAADRALRKSLLMTAGLLVVFAFTVLNGTGGRVVALLTQGAVAVLRLPLERYRRTGEDGGQDSADESRLETARSSHEGAIHGTS